MRINKLLIKFNIKMIKIEGIATISKNGFKFDSGLPSDEPLLQSKTKLHGKLEIEQNGSVRFVDNGRIYMPPVVNKIAQGEGYKIRRTSKNYIISVKLPIVEKITETQNKLTEMIPQIVDGITKDRKELIN